MLKASNQGKIFSKAAHAPRFHTDSTREWTRHSGSSGSLHPDAVARTSRGGARRALAALRAAAPRCHRLRRPPSTRREGDGRAAARSPSVPPPEAILAVCFATPVCSHVRGGAEDPLPKHFRTPLPPYRIRVGILATSHSQPRYHVMCTTRPTPGLALGGQSLRLPNGSHSDRPFTGTRWVSLACLSMDAALGCGERSTLVLPFVAHSWLIRVSFVGSSVLHSSEG